MKILKQKKNKTSNLILKSDVETINAKNKNLESSVSLSLFFFKECYLKSVFI